MIVPLLCPLSLFFLATLCSMWDLPRPGIELAPSAVEAQSLNHCTAREVQPLNLLDTTSVVFDSFLAQRYRKMFQIHLVHFLPHTSYQVYRSLC